MEASTTADRRRILIAGGGAAGSAMALALHARLGDEVEIVVIEPKGASEAAASDPRAYAIAAASRRLLDNLGVWEAVAGASEAVREIRITDSGLDDGVRPVRLTYENSLADGEAASHITPAGELVAALAERTLRVGTIRRVAGAFHAMRVADGHVAVTLDSAAALTGALLIGADGRTSRVRAACGIDVVGWAHRQSGIVTRIAIEDAHDGLAVQHFLPGGPFAMLPLPDRHYCITWSEARAEAERLMTLADADFLVELQRRIGGRFGRVSLAGPRRTFPLATHIARAMVAARTALIGDAAHGVHPIAGQGLNLALKDVAALADCIADSAEAGLDLADATGLSRYERWRRFDSVGSALAFDGLNRLFSADPSLLRILRSTGLGIVDRLPPLKRLLTAEAAGTTGELPSLMKL